MFCTIWLCYIYSWQIIRKDYLDFLNHERKQTLAVPKDIQNPTEEKLQIWAVAIQSHFSPWAHDKHFQINWKWIQFGHVVYDKYATCCKWCFKAATLYVLASLWVFLFIEKETQTFRCIACFWLFLVFMGFSCGGWRGGGRLSALERNWSLSFSHLLNKNVGFIFWIYPFGKPSF